MPFWLRLSCSDEQRLTMLVKEPQCKPAGDCLTQPNDLVSHGLRGLVQFGHLTAILRWQQYGGCQRSEGQVRCGESISNKESAATLQPLLNVAENLINHTERSGCTLFRDPERLAYQSLGNRQNGWQKYSFDSRRVGCHRL